MNQVEVIQRLSRWYSGAIHDSMDQLGIWGVLEGFNLYGYLPKGGKICGPATTVQFIPSPKRVFMKRYLQAIDQVGQGGILVMDTAGAKGSCHGELMSLGTKMHGGIGSVVNGTIRDLPEIESLGDYPVYAKGLVPLSAVGRMEDIAYNVEIEINSVRISPGDIIFADRDGVIVIPQQAAELVADMAEELAKQERYYKQGILSRKSMLEIFKEK
jgi:4-hydroxy-4-methyl-2-oxoglutarate aldolase